MKRLLLAALLALGFAAPASAQTFVVATCPGDTAVAGAGQRGVPFAIDVNGTLCTSGAGGGGAVTIASGADVTEGATGDAAATVGSTGTLSAKLRLMTTQLDAITTNTGAAIPAGTALIGKVGIDQTTPGTTNGVAIAQIGAATVSTGSGVMGTGTLRTALATDSPGIVTLGQAAKAASVPVTWASDQVGTAGTANATVLTVQGVASMTPIVANPTNGYPNGAIAETVSATGTTGATTATLATAVGKTTYICGFAIRANATAAATGTATVTGTITATMSFVQWTAPLASGIGDITQRFTPCIPASATNTSIAVVSAAPGAGGTVSVAAWGFQL